MLSKHPNKNLHFSNRVVFVFAAIASVPLIALFSFIIAIMHGRAVSGLESMCERVLETNVKRVNELIDTCSVVEKTLYVNSDMMFFLSSLKFREEEEIIDFIREENQTVERIISVIPKIYSIRIFSSGPGFLERFPVFLNERREDLPALSKWEFNYSADFYGPRTSLWQPSACKTIEIKNGRQHIGYMQVAIRMEDFFPFLAQRNSIWEKDFVFIKKEDQTGSFSLSQISLENSAPELLEKDDLENFTKAIAAGKEGKTCRVYIKGKRNIVSWVEHKELGIIMAHTCSIQMILQSILFMVFFSLLGLILVIACFYCIIRFTSNRMFNGIYSVMQGMKEVKGGNLSVQIPVSGWPEVMETQQTFNSMTQQLSSQIEQIKNEQELIADTEIKAMQNQINAHFIYNVLETIHMQAILANNKDISRSIVLLGKMLRYCLRWKIHTVTLANEIEYINSYVGILNIRNDYEIKLNVQISEKELNLKIPKMILQPFVENSFIHAIEPLAEDSEIKIYTERDEAEEKIWLCVKDSGIGMEDDKIDEILSYLADEKYEKDSTGSIGIKNIQQRLFLFYGQSFKLQIYSEKGRGTLVRIPLPIKGDNRQ